MVRMVWWCGVAAACLAASVAAADLTAPTAKPGRAGDEEALSALKEEHERLERRLARLEGERAEEREPSLLEAARRVEVHGFVDGLFSWNVDDPDLRKGANGQRLVDPDHDTLGVPLATLSLVRRTSGGNELDGGFGLTAAYGRLVEEALRDDGLFDDGPLDIPEAYVELQLPTPWRRAFLRAGRTYGFLGAETLDLSRSACVSLSPLAAFGPKTLTGLAVGLELAPGLTYTQWVGNGWDQVIDANDSKTLGGQLRLDAGPVDVTASWLSGAERADSASDRRWIGQVEVGVRPWAGLSARASLMAGEERGAAVGGGLARFAGASLVATQGFFAQDSGRWHRVSLTGRGSVLRDRGGSRTGVDQTLSEATATLELRPIEQAALRVEYRHDRSSEPVFGAGSRTQDTIAVELRFGF